MFRFSVQARCVRRALLIAAACVPFVEASALRAADIQWTGTTGDYNTATNWQGGVVPGAMDNAIVNNGGVVQITSDVSSNDLRAGDGSATATGTYNQTAGTANVTSWVRIGSQGNGTVAGVGTYNLSGGALKTGGPVLIGELGGTGTFTQTGGAITVGGGNWFSIAQGMNGTGTYNMSAGTLAVGGDFNVSDNPGSTATLNLSGTGAITAPNVFIGKSAGAKATVVQTGGSLTAGAGGIKASTDPASTATYTLSGGTLDAGGSPFIAGPGTFTFTFTGGTLQNVGSINFPLTQGGGTFHPISTSVDPKATPVIYGTQISAPYTLGAGATMLFDLNSGGQSDEIVTTANITLAGLLSLHVPGGAQLDPTKIITLIDAGPGVNVTGTFANALSSITADNGQLFNINYHGGDGNDVVATPVPEPLTSTALAAVAGTLFFRKRRTHR